MRKCTGNNTQEWALKLSLMRYARVVENLWNFLKMKLPETVRTASKPFTMIVKILAVGNGVHLHLFM
jgi:hypothetical protein